MRRLPAGRVASGTRRGAGLMVGMLVLCAAACTLTPSSSSTVSVPAGRPYETTSHEFRMYNYYGYVLKVTVRIGPWLKGSDAAGLESAWYQVSGETGMPLVSGRYAYDRFSGPFDLESTEALYVFGTLSVEYLSPAGEPADFFRTSRTGNGEPHVQLWWEGTDWSSEELLESDGTGRFYWCVERQCEHSAMRHGVVEFKESLVFDNDGNVGSVPFVSAVAPPSGVKALGDDYLSFPFKVKCPATSVIDPGAPYESDPFTTGIGW